MEIRSYRNVFNLERRVYSVDRVRLNPGGVPLRGVVYFLVALFATVSASSLPGLAVVAHGLPWYLRDIALPGVVATALAAVRIEGRTFHLAARALARFYREPRRLAGIHVRASVGARWHPQDILLVPDGSDAKLRRLRYTGPGAVLVAVQHERSGRAVERGGRGWARRGPGPELRLRARADARARSAGEVISLAEGATVLVSGASRGPHG